MTEFLKTFETLGSVTAEQVLAFAALILPGFISLRVYEMRRGGEARKTSDVLFDLVIYSFATDLVAFAAFGIIGSTVAPSEQPSVKSAVAVLLFVVVPIAFAVIFFNVQRSLMRAGAIPDTISNPWNRMLDRISRDRIDAGVIVTLRDGRVIAARLGSAARASSEGDDLLLGEVWTLDNERATLVEATLGSYGILVNRADCETIEFVRWNERTSRKSAGCGKAT